MLLCLVYFVHEILSLNKFNLFTWQKNQKKTLCYMVLFFCFWIGMCPLFYDYLYIMGFSAFFIYILKFYLSYRAVFVAHLCVCTHRCANNWKRELKPQFQVRNSVFLSWLQLLHTCVSVHTDVQQVLPHLTHTHTY